MERKASEILDCLELGWTCLVTFSNGSKFNFTLDSFKDFPLRNFIYWVENELPQAQYDEAIKYKRKKIIMRMVKRLEE